MPEFTEFGALTGEGKEWDPDKIVRLGIDEYEVLRLIDYMGFSQEKCAKRMNVARTTIARMYEIARKKITEMLVLGKKLVITGGEITICEKIRPECVNEPHCCHRKEKF